MMNLTHLFENNFALEFFLKWTKAVVKQQYLKCIFSGCQRTGNMFGGDLLADYSNKQSRSLDY